MIERIDQFSKMNDKLIFYYLLVKSLIFEVLLLLQKTGFMLYVSKNSPTSALHRRKRGTG